MPEDHLIFLAKVGIISYLASNSHSIIRFCKKRVTELMIKTGYINIEEEIKTGRNMLIFATSKMEYINRSLKTEYKLDGWGENVLENITDYDGIIERLVIENSTMDTVIVPAVELMMALNESAFRFHLFKTTNPMYDVDVFCISPEHRERMKPVLAELVSKQTTEEEKAIGELLKAVGLESEPDFVEVSKGWSIF